MSRLIVVGIGTEKEHLTMGAVAALRGGATVVLHTQRCGAAEWLREQDISFRTLDALYERAEDFDAHSLAAAREILRLAEEGDVVYGVFDVRDLSVEKLLELGAKPEIVAGPPMEGALMARAAGPTEFFEASDWQEMRFHADRNALIREIDSRELAGEVKIKLMDCYPDQTRIFVRMSGGEIAQTELVNLDRLAAYDHRVSALIPAQRDLTRLERYGFDELVRVIHRLRAPDGCPWDRKQTHQTLRTNLIEEAYEAVDAINREDMDALYDELGDVLLQVVLHAEIGSEHGEFTIGDVTTAIASKMIARHEHVFGSAHAETPDQVLSLWQEIKKKERHQSTQAEVLKSVTAGLPGLMRAEKVQKRASDVGFDWKSAREAFYKIGEETQELSRAMDGQEAVEDEAGDLLFSVVNVLRLLKIDPELALTKATDKFIRRFEKMEQAILADGKNFGEMSLETMDSYWDRVKLSEKAPN